MKKWTGTLMNFFFPGLGYLVFGPKRGLGVVWLLGAVGLTYVELSIQEPLPQVYWVMFVSVFAMNTAFAIDIFRELGKEEQPVGAPQPAVSGSLP